MNPEDEAWRVILNWIIPTSLAMTIVKVATKLLEKDTTLWGAFLTTIISMLTGVIVGGIVYLITEGIWQSLVATSIASLLGERVGHWFIYDFEIDKALNKISRAILDKIMKVFK